MSELYVNGKTIIAPMESGTCTWENTSLKCVGTWYRKDNICNLKFAWTAKTSLTAGTSISITGDMPSAIFPKQTFSFTTLLGQIVYAIGLDTSGKFYFVTTGAVGNGNSADTATTYLID